MRIPHRAPLTILLVSFALTSHARVGHAEFEPTPRLRRPVALATSADGKWLYAANRRSGSLSAIDLTRRAVVAEADVGELLADLVRLEDGRLLVVDEGRHELVLLRAAGADLTVLSRVSVSSYPVEVVATRDGRRAFVSSLWSRRVSEVALPARDGEAMAVARVVDLPFAPRKLLLASDDRQLLVGDAFAGRLGVMETASGDLLSVRALPAHNIRGLSVTPDGRMVAVAHQMLNSLAHTVRNDVHWGLLLSNDLRWLRLEAVLNAQADLHAGAHMHPLGDAGRGGADPSDLVFASNGLVLVAMGGANQVAVGREQDFSLRRIEVGRRPTALVFAPDERHAYVGNTFDDTISILDVKREEVAGEISLGPQADLSLMDRGELLFYDGAMSHDQWMSCHSCHTDGHANGMLNDNQSDDSFGAPKRVLTLLGVAETGPFAWNGSVVKLEDQVLNSIRKTMQRGEPPRKEDVGALTAYLESLSPPPSMDAARGVADSAAIERGKTVFHVRKCDRCHAPPIFTTPQTYDVGLVDEQGNRHFNPPSLRGVGQRGSYFHDGRAATLEEVFQIHGHQVEGGLPPSDLADLLAFLRSL